MKFSEAFKLMKQGAKVKLPGWGGFWYWDAEKKTIIMHTKDGEEMDIRETQVVDYTFSNVACDDWVIADNQNCPELGGEATFSFGEAIKYLKRGMNVARKGWNGKKQYIQLDELPELPRKGLSDPCGAGFFRCILGNARTFLQIGWTKHRFSSCQNAIARSVCLSNKWMRLISTAAVMVSPA